MNKTIECVQPPYLQEGDVIGIVAPARFISRQEVEPAMDVLQSWGYQVKLGAHLFGNAHQFSGTDEQRAADMQAMILDPDIRAILCARGGYGTARIMDLVDWSHLSLDPKWIIGYSDATVIHSHLQQQLGLESLHATMPLSFPENVGTDSLESLRNALAGHLRDYVEDSHPLNQPGSCSGVLCGGNLSVLYSIMGSPSEVSFHDKILFLEDLDEYLYHIDRMMLNLSRAGKLKGIRGLVLGGFTEMRDNNVPFGKTAEKIIREYFAGMDIPMAFGFPSGHTPRNLSLYMGRRIHVTIGHQVRLSF